MGLISRVSSRTYRFCFRRLYQRKILLDIPFFLFSNTMSEHSINKLPPQPHHSQSLSSNSQSNNQQNRNYEPNTDLDLSQLTIQNDENDENLMNDNENDNFTTKHKHFSGP